MKRTLFVLASVLLLASCGGTSSTPKSTSSSEGDTSVESQVSSPEESKASYTITFKDETGAVLDSRLWEEGTTPSYNYQKDDTQEWDYTFEGWSTSLGGEVITIPAVSGEATYFAIVSQVKQRYTLTFDSGDGSEVASITEDYGTSIDKPDDPTWKGHKFVAWSYDEAGEEKVTWPLTLTESKTLYANWNEIIDIKAYLSSLVGVLKQDPFGYIPEKMRPTNSANHVQESQVTYDFNSFVNVSDIKYGGYGEQWNMVIGNIAESQRFYSAIAVGETILNASIVAFNNYLDSNPSDTATHTLKETDYTAKLDFHNGVLTYILQYKTGWNIPFFGEVLPQIDMVYDVASGERSARIQLSENNAMRYIVRDGYYAFAIEYGVTAVSRKAFFEIDAQDEENIKGHIYEYVQFKDKDLVPSCADFYITPDWTSVVGNKASGMPGFAGYINELYRTEEGKLLGYEVRETFTKWAITATYHTLWFNLNNISGINNVKAIPTGEVSTGLGAQNPHEIYLNNSASIFEPTYNTKLGVKTSRKYDVEMRKQSFFGYKDDALTEFQVEIPMMFIQADHDGYTNFSDFPADILSKSGISAQVTMSSTVLNKIQSDYASLIDVFIGNKDKVTGDAIETYIGQAKVIGD